jgi:hypothetical protein
MYMSLKKTRKRSRKPASLPVPANLSTTQRPAGRPGAAGNFCPWRERIPTSEKPVDWERLEEYRIEFIASDENAAAVARALVEAHPYEEPAWGAFRMADADELLADESAWL